jgi:DNA primase
MTSILDSLSAIAPERAAKARRGHNYILIPCPYHGGGQEKTPSLSISTSAPVFFCHACLEGGALVRLLRDLGAASTYAQNIVNSSGYSRSDRGRKEKRSAVTAYKAGLDPYRAKFVLEEEILDTYRIAPTSLLDAGYHNETLRHFEVGVDIDRARVTYPIRSLYGELMGISGRTLIDEEPRYKIYKQELAGVGKNGWSIPEDYSIEEGKRANLWHMHLVYPFLLAGEDAVVVTEGFKACMWTYQCGFQPTVALIGAYMSPLHASLITRVCRKAVLFLDHNEAGWKGTALAGQQLEKVGVDVYVARYPDDREQPDDLNTEEVNEAVTTAYRFIEWRRI